MSTALKLFDPNQSASPSPLPITLSAEQLRQFAAQIAAELRSPTVPAMPAEDVYRPVRPVYVPAKNTEQPAFTLRAAFESFFSRCQPLRSQVRWGDFRSLINRCEEVWKGQGRDVRTISAADWQATFEGIASWRTQRAWAKAHRCLYQVLNANCRQTRKNRQGVPLGTPAPLDLDSLPIWDIPPEQWFLRRGIEPAASLPALSVEEFSRVITACGTTADPVYWRTLLAFWWYCAMRRTDSTSGLCWFSSRTRMGIDVERRWLRWKNSKPPHEVYDIPLPEWLNVGFRELAKRGRESVFYLPNLKRRLYPTLAEICSAANVDSRTPNDFRKSGTTHWRMIAPQHENRFTAHKEQTTIGKHYVQLSETQLREIAESFPRPSVPLV